MTARQKELQFKIQAELNLAHERVRLPKLHYCNSLKQITMDANIAVASIHTNSLEDTMRLVYATALVVTREMGYSVMQTRSVTASQAVPPWKRHITSKIARLRSDLSQLEQMKSGKLKNTSGLIHHYLTCGKHISTVIEELKQKVMALSGKLSRFNKSCLRHHQNNLFNFNQRRLYTELNGGVSSAPSTSPDKEAIVGYWSDLWSKQVVYNGTAQWLENQRLDMLNTVCLQEEFQITLDKVTKQLRRVKNWKAPGHDAFHGYWLKYLTNMHPRLASYLQDIFQKGPPEWLTLGRTVLVVKDINKGMNPANFRPITCLPTV